MKTVFELGINCNKQGKCASGCRYCLFYIKKNKNNNYGLCVNKQSDNYNQEIYDKSCCTYICNRSLI